MALREEEAAAAADTKLPVLLLLPLKEPEEPEPLLLPTIRGHDDPIPEARLSGIMIPNSFSCCCRISS